MWKHLRQRFDSYALITGLADRGTQDWRGHTNAICLGEEAIEIVETIPFVRPEDKQDLQKALNLLDKYFQGNVNITFERFQFLKRDQRENESFDEYLRSLRVLANTCEFGSLKTKLIRDRVGCGLREEHMQTMLLQKNKLTLTEVKDTCRASEATAHRLKVINAVSDKDNRDAASEFTMRVTTLTMRETHGADVRTPTLQVLRKDSRSTSVSCVWTNLQLLQEEEPLCIRLPKQASGPSAQPGKE